MGEAVDYRPFISNYPQFKSHLRGHYDTKRLNTGSGENPHFFKNKPSAEATTIAHKYFEKYEPYLWRTYLRRFTQPLQ